MKTITRRHFTKLMGGTGLTLTLPTSLAWSQASPPSSSDKLSVHIFSKHLQFLDYKGMSEASKEMGFAGLDLTVRPKGHIEPSRVKDQLPEAVQAIKSFDLQPVMMTTSIKDIEEENAKDILDTASNLGFKFFRTGWLKYTEESSIPESVANYTKKLKKLEAYTKKLKICAAYQNHTGYYFGSSIWDMWQAFKDKPSDWWGCQYDIRHAVVEGGVSWYQDLRLIHPYIKTLVLKDFLWKKVNGAWRPHSVPIGEGMVDFPKYFKFLRAKNIQVPISLHMEYPLGGAEKGSTQLSIDQKEVFQAMKKDLQKVQELWEQSAS